MQSLKCRRFGDQVRVTHFNVIRPIKFFRTDDENSYYFKCKANHNLNFDIFSRAVELCKNHGGIENPLVDNIIGQILTDKNYPSSSNWNVPRSSIKKYFLEKSDQLNTGENIENGWWSSSISSTGMK